MIPTRTFDTGTCERYIYIYIYIYTISTYILNTHGLIGIRSVLDVPTPSPFGALIP